ncbi:thiamine phosphate synthase [Elioraea tepidiphila]|uniref:thiamine phosphate synthase n=1 Tax=Elioraea tepidiphila TaxID=457934 RepID=UPI00316AECA6
MRRLPWLILMTDPARGGDPLAAAAALPRGCVVILRHDSVPGRADLAKRLARLCRARGLRLSIARDARLALRLGTGLHLADGMEPPVLWRLHRRGLLTVAAHGPAALARARRMNADLALLSPLFPTASHPGARALGTVRFARFSRAARLPVAALGGITALRVTAAARAGAAAIAAVGALAARPCQSGAFGLRPPPPVLQPCHGVP